MKAVNPELWAKAQNWKCAQEEHHGFKTMGELMTALNPLTGRLDYASAGHPYAFRIPRFGEPERLEATAPPLGLATAGSIKRRQVPWRVGADLLVLWTDGLVDARNEAGEPFGEQRLLAEVCAHRTEPVEEIVRAVLAEAEAFGSHPVDDRTLLVLRI